MHYIPYTYLIGWSKLNKFYYGCEYGNITKTANPSNLWTSYFTSSKLVYEYRNNYGEPDIIQVRKTFCCSQSAKLWEEKVLRKMKVLSNEKFLNENISGVEFGLTSKRFAGKTHTPESIEKNRQSQLGRKHTEKTKSKISKGNKNKVITLEVRNKISKANKGRKMTNDFCEKRSKYTSGKNNPKYDPTLYNFIHPVYGKIRCTKYYLKKEYGATNIQKVIKGDPK
jgi:hypothetical protein